MANKDVELEIDANTSGFRRAIQEMMQSARDGAKGVENSFAPLQKVFDGVRGHIAALGVAVSAGAFTALIKNSIDAADHLNDMAQRTGMSVEVLAGLKLVADQSGTSLEGLGTAFKKLSVNLVDASSGNKEMSAIFRALDISGTNAQAAMYRLADIMKTLPDGAQKTALAIKLLGKAGEEMIPLLNLGGKELREMIERGQELSGVTKEMAEQADQFNDQLAELKVQSQATGVAMAKYALPALNDIARAMREAAKEGGILKALWVGLGGAGAAMFTDEFADAPTKIKNLQNEISRLLLNKSEVQFGGLLHRWLYGTSESIDAEIKAKMEQIEALKRAMAQPPKQPDAPKTPAVDVTKVLGAGNKATSGRKASTEKGPDSYMQYYEGALEEEKRLAYERDALRGYSKGEELAFWRALLANAELTGKDRLAIERKISGLVVDTKRAEAKQKMELDGEGLRSHESLALGKVEAERAAAQVSLDLGLMTKAQFFAHEEQFERQRFEIQRAALAERMKLLELDPNTNPVEFARLKNQILELEQQHELKRIQMRGMAAQEEMGVFGNLANRMGGLWDKGMQAMLNGTLTWRNAIKAIGAEMVGWFVMEVVGKQVKAWIAGETMKIARKMGFFAAEKAMTLAEIPALAGRAGAGGVASMAAAPFPVNMSAPAFGAAMMGAAMAYAPLAAAAGGYDIPRGINPITQLHQEEMVLPAHLANPMRDMLAQGGNSGGAVHLHVSAVDADSVSRLFSNNSAALAEVLRRQVRNFTPIR